MHIKSISNEFSDFIDVSKQTLNRNAPCKQKIAVENYMAFMNKAYSKELREITHLRNKL